MERQCLTHYISAMAQDLLALAVLTCAWNVPTRKCFSCYRTAHESFLTKFFACWYTCNYTSKSFPDVSEII